MSEVAGRRKGPPEKPLVICDLDGTLLDDEPQLEPGLARRLNDLIERGLDFTFASARSVHIARTLLGDLRIRLPVIEYNGAFITDFATGEKLVENYLKEEVAPALRELAARRGLEPLIFCRRDGLDLLLPPKSPNTSQRKHLDFLTRKGDVRLRHEHTADDCRPAGNLILTFSGEAEELRRFTARIPRRLADLCDIHRHADPYCPGMDLLMVQDKDSTKCAAGRKLAALLGRGLDEVVAFGDQVNDISLLREAAWGVAVANAAPELKEVADEVCGANTEGGVVNWLEQNVRLGRGGER